MMHMSRHIIWWSSPHHIRKTSNHCQLVFPEHTSKQRDQWLCEYGILLIVVSLLVQDMHDVIFLSNSQSLFFISFELELCLFVWDKEKRRPSLFTALIKLDKY